MRGGSVFGGLEFVYLIFPHRANTAWTHDVKALEKEVFYQAV